MFTQFVTLKITQNEQLTIVFPTICRNHHNTDLSNQIKIVLVDGRATVDETWMLRGEPTVSECDQNNIVVPLFHQIKARTYLPLLNKVGQGRDKDN